MSGSSRRLFAALVMVGITVGGPARGTTALGVAAQIPSADGVIEACVRIDRGGDAGRLTRLVAADERCRGNEIRVRWNVVGPAAQVSYFFGEAARIEHLEHVAYYEEQQPGSCAASSPSRLLARPALACRPSYD